MWLRHFIFEGLLFTFSKTAGKVVTLWQNGGACVCREISPNVLEEKGKWREDPALNAYEDISEGGGFSKKQKS